MEVQELSSAFSSFIVTHVRRSANSAGHACPNSALLSALGSVWAFQPLASCRQACCSIVMSQFNRRMKLCPQKNLEKHALIS
jgi:hypothetical protein